MEDGQGEKVAEKKMVAFEESLYHLSLNGKRSII